MSQRREPLEAPIINLEEVRERRRIEAERKAHVERRGVQLFQQQQALTDAIGAKRVHFGELMDMIRLGIITDDEERLPCHEYRDADYYRWARQTYNIQLDDEEEPPIDPNGPDGPDGPDGLEPADRHRVQCPLLAGACIGDDAPPCIEALRLQARYPVWTSKRGLVRKPLDGTDPVVAYQLRPCVLLGHYAIVGAMQKVWDREK